MNKFEKMISASSSETLGKRGRILAETTISELEAFISVLKSEKRGLETKILDLTDLSPENTYDLRPGGKNFNAKTWVASLHETRMDIALKLIELEEAQAMFTEWFGEEKEEKDEKSKV